jgi:hypothetical protein
VAAPRSGPETVRQQLAGRPVRDHPAAMRGASFTERIVAELAPHVPPLGCCRAALIEGMALAGDGGSPVTTRLVAARAALAVLHADAIPASVERLATARRHRYRVTVRGTGPTSLTPSANLCCSRSRLRGVFLASGSLSRGDGPPQLELLVGSEAAAARVVADLERLDIPFSTLRRRGRPVVAVRSAAGVATLLSSIGAHLGRLEFESSPPPSPSSRRSTAWSGTGAGGSGCHRPSARRPCCAGAGPRTAWRHSPKLRAAAGRRWPGACTAWWPSAESPRKAESPAPLSHEG